MKVQLGHIVQNLFHTGSLNEVPVSELQELAETHPYFGAGHLLLSQKLKHEQSSGFETQIQKTALYFHDPLWLHWQLDQHEKEVAVVEEEPEVQPEPERQTELKSVGHPEPESKPEVQPGTGFEPGQDPAKTAEPEEGTGSIYEPDSIEPPAQPNPEADPPPPEPEPEPEPEPKVDEPTTEPPANLPGPDTEQPAPIKEPQTTNHQPQTTNSPEPQTRNPKPETAPAFEPYHTIDYFASQGIKISAEVQPNDRLGKQLKSFTEWLKTMKRLPQTAPDEQVEENGDQDIRRIAAGSLEGKEVVTETMAEVLLKQDKRDEAIAIYEKLSLLDPSKRAYFAAKIENLKEN